MKIFGRVFIVGLLACFLGLAPNSGKAAEQKSVAEKILEILMDRGDITLQQYQELKKEAQAEHEALIRPKEDDWDVKWKNGLSAESPDGNFSIKLGGRIQIDWASISADDEVENALGDDFEGFGTEFRRARLFMSGMIYKVAEYKAQFDFAGDEVTAKDLYLGLTDLPVMGKVRVGHQKEPFSLEEQTSSKYITFLERALPNVFSPGRNMGIQIMNSALEKKLFWGAGVFWDTEDGADNFNDFADYNITARVAGTPWYSAGGRRLMHLGLGYSHLFRDDVETEFRFRQRPEVHLAQARTVDTGDTNVFDRFYDSGDLIGAEAAVVFGPLSVQGEYIQAMVDGANEDYDFTGAYLYAGYFLTGESRPYKGGSFSRVKPNNNFDLQGGLGAWEIAVRWSYLDLNDGGIDGGEETNYTVGVNWYLNPALRVMVNYVYGNVEDRTIGGTISDADINSVAGRFAVDF